MIFLNPIAEHRAVTQKLARSLAWTDVYHWLCQHGYFPEGYVLPPCFTVVKRPKQPRLYYKVSPNGKNFKVDRAECATVHFPKTELTDATFGLINPQIHNDIAYHLSRNWKRIVDALIPKKSQVTSYTFPLPIDAKNPGRLSFLRSGRSIYEFIGMVDRDIAAIAYQYSYLVKTDIKNFYPSIYTHSIAWALHGKKFIRKKENLHNYKHLGNRLDRLFQNANDGCTNGIPIGPVVSDLIAEIVASAVDIELTKKLQADGIDCEVVRFKDDYRILVKSEDDARTIIKLIQSSLKTYNLEINELKTSISELPDGLFRDWVSRYHVVHPRKRKKYSWKEFREIYLAVIQINRECPGTGVIDRFLADMISRDGNLKIEIYATNLQKVISMLLMLANLHVKAFPKIIAILESILRSPFGNEHRTLIVEYLEEYLIELAADEERNRYLITWIGYFLVSNKLMPLLVAKPKVKDPICRSVISNQSAIFKDCKEHKVFLGCVTTGKKVSMLQHLDIFNPPDGSVN